MKETEQVNQEVLRNVANENSDACTHTHTHRVTTHYCKTRIS